ncbi:GILT-like protein 1 isoform X1 [Musca domestica]|uniref:Gamma-interferon-inducible lysosomal thiol reductase isoform X1 n=1 Tax=Musca domestica TaxID=7370 RepID=A0A1I8NCL7_MUSDO|nr:GILT-like protein 1 isoform X1 [Musca domestica]
MVSQTRKRILILLSVVVILFLLVRYVFFNGSLEASISSAPQLVIPQQQHESHDSQTYRRAPGAPVIVTVFYEALCPDSKHFITKQLIPAFKEASILMDTRLVPYGKASTMTNPDGTFRFDCQHGQVECEANTYHACTIEAVQEPQARLDMIACMIRDNRLPKDALHKCAKQHNIDNVDLIQKCFDSSHGSELLKLNGDLTHALRPSITFIPTITLDGYQGKQALILKNLLAEICKIAGDNEKADEICGQHS